MILKATATATATSRINIGVEIGWGSGASARINRGIGMSNCSIKNFRYSRYARGGKENHKKPGQHQKHRRYSSEEDARTRVGYLYCSHNPLIIHPKHDIRKLKMWIEAHSSKTSLYQA